MSRCKVIISFRSKDQQALQSHPGRPLQGYDRIEMSGLWEVQHFWKKSCALTGGPDMLGNVPCRATPYGLWSLLSVFPSSVMLLLLVFTSLSNHLSQEMETSELGEKEKDRKNCILTLGGSFIPSSPDFSLSQAMASMSPSCLPRLNLVYTLIPYLIG